MAPKWQRGRILVSQFTESVGRDVWVALERPVTRGGWLLQSGEFVDPTPSYLMHLIDQGRQIAIFADRIELLARDEDDFADSVELIPWETFLEQCRATPAKEPTR